MQNHQSFNIPIMESSLMAPGDGARAPTVTPNVLEYNLGAGMQWASSQMFSPQLYHPQQMVANLEAAAYPMLFNSTPHTLDTNSLLRSINPEQTTATNNNNNMTIQIGLQCMNEGSIAPACAIPTDRKVIRANRKPAESDRQEQQRMLLEFMKLATHGCDQAEKVAKNYKFRPCFKKIDSLCARLKQDIGRPDGVQNNLNSQGMAWAAKDFIFVYTRIINAWLILKGYVYSKSDGMKKVQSLYSEGFEATFFEWQRVTQDLIGNIVQSFENMDLTMQKSRGAGPNGAVGANAGGHKMNKEVDLKHFLWENKAVTMRANGQKSGGHPLGRPVAEVVHQMETAGSSPEPMTQRLAVDSYYKTGFYDYNKRSPEASISSRNESVDESGDFDKENESSCLNATGHVWDLIDKLDLEDNLKKFEAATEGNIRCLMERVGQIQEASIFFKLHFLKNYFPNFEKVVPDFKDLYSIGVDVEQGRYKYMFSVVADLRMIVQSCKLYLTLSPNAPLIELVQSFERSLELILTDKRFSMEL